MGQSPRPRIAPLEPPYEPEIARTLERMMGTAEVEPLRLFRAVAHNRHVLDKFRSAGSYFLNFGTLDPGDREVVTERTCARCCCEYEWGVHAVVYGRHVGLSEEQLQATVSGDADDPVWSAHQSLLVRLVDELHDTGMVSNELWAKLAEIYDAAQLVELVALVGQYHLVAFLANALEVEHEDWAARWAPAQPA